jgi:hypothetical protein
LLLVLGDALILNAVRTDLDLKPSNATLLSDAVTGQWGCAGGLN